MDASLRTALRNRMRLLGSSDESTTSGGDAPKWVLYWMRTAMRGHDNPALDVAVSIANERGVPVVVYQELRADGPRPYPSDRHHTFVLEGARDVDYELRERGIRYALYVEGANSQPHPLESLASDAAAVVIEDLPAHWHRRASLELAKRVSPPVWAVDTACIVPMKSVSGEYDRAYKFRKAHSPLLTDQLQQRRPSVDPEMRPVDEGQLPFNPVDLQSASISDLVAACPVDHSIAPVADKPGGAQAGYNRWRAFRDDGIQKYHQLRNNAAYPKAVSRLSAYLHYGQVSPFRVARQAAALEGDGPEKYIDEMVTWREFAHHVCDRRSRPPGWNWLPDWAQKTLEDHAGDRREANYDWETLARGRSDDELWNLCQRSLLAHGELHNNLRMTWGKKLLHWTSNPREAIELAIDLNDRYALDGADPNSYLGILWCFGGFDRPFEPERDVIGTVRPRSTERHAQRLDMEKYRQWVHRPRQGQRTRVAVVGGGIAGLTCGRTLRDHNLEVRIFDKGRGPGGRTSTRRSRQGVDFDHGAPHFAVQSEQFQRYVDAWRKQDAVAEWSPRPARIDGGLKPAENPSGNAPYFVGTPGMNAICSHLGRDVDVEYEAEARNLHPTADGQWMLELDDGNRVGPFDAVVVAAPAPQTAQLLADHAPDLAKYARTVDFSPTWSVMIGFEYSLDLGFDTISVDDGPVDWAVRDNSKPGRQAGDDAAETWVIYATPRWSEDHLEWESDRVADHLSEAFIEALERDPSSLPESLYCRAHRWRYGRPNPTSEQPPLTSRESTGLFISGDWLRGPRIEDAFHSGLATAGRILGDIDS